MNKPRFTEELIHDADAAHRIALRSGDPELIKRTGTLLRGLEDLDKSITHAVTTLRRGSDSPSASRQQDQQRERDRWTIAS